MSKKVVVEGEIIVKDGTHSAIEFYEGEEFVLSDEVKTLAQARAIIQSGLITERMRKKIPNFKRVRTCQVISFSNDTAEPEISNLDRLLIEATTLGCVPENIDNYRRPDYKTKALEKAIETHKARKLPKDTMQDEGYVD